MRTLWSFLYSCLAICTVGCTSRNLPAIGSYAIDVPSTAPRYNDLRYWAAHPWKADPSDSLPADITARAKDSVVDVFFLHPTTYTTKNSEWIANINDPALNQKTDNSSILYQASVFNQHARVFAPRYRQANYWAFFTNDPGAQAAFDTAYTDIRTAFEYYLQHDNHGRPLIIAGHSQGAKMALRLLKEFFDGKPLQKQLVAAYIVGWPAPATYFQNIPVCSTPDQTGCFCSWRTFREGYRPSYVKKETFTAAVTNPLSWTTTNEAVSRDLNKGGVLRDFNQVVPRTTNARISGNVLWTKKPKFPGSFFFRTKNYHIGDINLFYMNIRENITQRIKAYQQQH